MKASHMLAAALVAAVAVALGDAYDSVVKDPCEMHHCGSGKECISDEGGNPLCVCKQDCPLAYVEDQVCASVNVTFRSLCHLDQMRCWCKFHDNRCGNRQYLKAYLDYYGACKMQTECTEDDLIDFPNRLKEWFYNILDDLDSQDMVPRSVAQLAAKARREYDDQRYIYPVVWKFCEMDIHPRNNAITNKELIPLVSLIKGVEQCTSSFLEQADRNGDHQISLDEWAVALGYSSNDVSQWLGRCDDVLSVEEAKKFPF